MKKYIVIFAVVLALAAVAAAWYVLSNQSSNSADSALTKDQAIERASQFKPDGQCLSVMTPAVHEKTGARYTFPTSCLPEGWEKLAPATDYRSTEEDGNQSLPAEPDDQPSGKDGGSQATPDAPVSSPAAPNPAPAPNSSANDELKAEAIRDAKAYRPPRGSMCTTVMTTARHEATGAVHTFNNGCLPPGWVRISNQPTGVN